MKKLSYLLFLLLILAMFLISACGQSAQIGNSAMVPIDNNTTVPSATNATTVVQYLEMEASYRPYFSAKGLIEEADAVFIGKVTKISFQVLDLTTALPPTEETMDRHLSLHTIYDVDVEVSYKGDSSIKQIRQMGGIKDLYIEEQVSVLKNANAWKGGIPTLEAMKENIELGQTYLFAVGLFDETVLPTFYFPEQSIYNMHNPFEEHYNNLTVKSVISAFGQDKWDTYWNKWKTDNPDWETWIDKDAVDRALTAENSISDDIISIDFNFILKYGVGAKNMINTFNGTYRKDLITTSTEETELHLTDEDMQEIYKKMKAINILNYPSDYNPPYSDNPKPGVERHVEPNQTYILELAIDGVTKRITWVDLNCSDTCVSPE